MPIVVCDCCGCRRSSHACPRCGLMVCGDCWHEQGDGVGHLQAEHAHEIARDEGMEPDWWEEWPDA